MRVVSSTRRLEKHPIPRHDTPEPCEQVCELTERLLPTNHSVVVTALKNRNNPLDLPTVQAVYKQPAMSLIE